MTSKINVVSFETTLSGNTFLSTLFLFNYNQIQYQWQKLIPIVKTEKKKQNKPSFLVFVYDSQIKKFFKVHSITGECFLSLSRCRWRHSIDLVTFIICLLVKNWNLVLSFTHPFSFVLASQFGPNIPRFRISVVNCTSKAKKTESNSILFHLRSIYFVYGFKRLNTYIFSYGSCMFPNWL